jgi:nucleotide-binding universal stress UspA family protein
MRKRRWACCGADAFDAVAKHGLPCARALTKGAVMHRVLVPTDFSPAALLVTREVMSWVHAIEGELLLLHVVPDIFLRWLDHLAISFIDQSRLEAAYEDLRAEGQRKFTAWLPDLVPERCRTLVVVGETADAIVEVAQAEMVDVIIMRPPDRRWWRPLLAGGVTDTVMRRAPAPVLVWTGLERAASSGGRQGVRHPHRQDAHEEGAWQGRRRERWERTPVLRSWWARTVSPSTSVNQTSVLSNTAPCRRERKE